MRSPSGEKDPKYWQNTADVRNQRIQPYVLTKILLLQLTDRGKSAMTDRRHGTIHAPCFGRNPVALSSQ